MAEIRIKAEKRDATGKGPARRTRAAGKVPGVLYGLDQEAVAVAVDRRELALAYHTEAGMNVLLGIELDGDSTLALTKELQRDPVRGTLLHADFLRIDRGQTIDVDVPVNLVGESAGVKEGGVLEQPVHMLAVRCLPFDVPEAIEADISGLGIGDSLRVGDVTAAANIEILTDPDAVLVHVAAPITAEQMEAMEAGVVEGAPEEAAEAVPEEGVPPEGGEEQTEGTNA